MGDRVPAGGGARWPRAAARIGALDCTPWPWVVHAWHQDTLLATSDSAVQLSTPDHGPWLCIPRSSVPFDLLRSPDATEDLPGLGPVDPWRLADGPQAGSVAGWTVPAAPGAPAWLADALVLNHHTLRVELTDDVAGDGSVEPSRKQFPVWGDLDDLVDILDLRPAGDGIFLSVTRSSRQRAVVEGSQMLAQAVIAAMRMAPGRRVVSAHMLFVRAARVDQPLRFEMGSVSGGRTMTALTARVAQGDRTVACGTLLLAVPSTDVIRHQVDAAPVTGPDHSDAVDMSVTGRDIRVVDGAYTNDPAAPVGPPAIDAWVRYRQLGSDPALHAGLVTHFTGHMAVAAALRPHAGIGQDQAHRTLSTAINAIGLSLHRDPRADTWLRYHHHSTYAGDGMTHAECHIHDDSNTLVASFTVDAMVRQFDGEPAGDARSAL